MARSLGKPIMIYKDKSGRPCLLWPAEYKKGDKVEILKRLKEMARLVDEDKAKKVMESFAPLNELRQLKLQNDIAKFQQWKKDPGFDV